MSTTTLPYEPPEAALTAHPAASLTDRSLPQLPPGRHHLSPEFVLAHQRERLLRAVSDQCATNGYQSTTIAHIVRQASVSRRTFYKHFASKQECFLAAYQTTLAQLEERLRTASTGITPWPDRLAVVLKTMLDELAHHPTMAHTLFVDVLFAGPEVKRCRQAALRRCQRLLPLPDKAPPGVAETVIGGIVEMIYHTILEGRTSTLPSMYDEMLYCLLLPLLGHEKTSAVCSRTQTRVSAPANDT